jgi:hypothetical protein
LIVFSPIHADDPTATFLNATWLAMTPAVTMNKLDKLPIFGHIGLLKHVKLVQKCMYAAMSKSPAQDARKRLLAAFTTLRPRQKQKLLLETC